MDMGREEKRDWRKALLAPKAKR